MNPIKKFREEQNLTQVDLAKLANVSISVVSRVENGTFANVPPSITNAIKHLCGGFHHYADSSNLLRDYVRWVNDELTQIKLPNPLIDPDRSMTPEQFAVWRSVVCKLNGVADTAISFAGLFKLNIYVVDKWEKGTMKQIPSQILERVDYVRRAAQADN